MELAVFADCLKLIEEFVRNGDSSFDAFCNEWKKMAFQHIFSAQTSNVEICQTTSAIMHVTKRTVCGYTTTGEPLKLHGNSAIEQREYGLRRLGALYLMYAVYFKQPTQNYIKAEMTLKTWREMRDFVKSCEAKQARYLFWKLYKAGAFRFTATDYYVALDNLVNYDNIERHDQHSAHLKTDLVRELSAIHMIQTALPALVAKEEQYNDIKKQITDNNKTLNSQALPPLNICKNIQNVFKRIGNILKGVEAPETNNNNTDAPCSSNTRRAIKRKAFGGDYSMSEQMSQDEDTVADDDDDEDDDLESTVAQKKNCNIRRISAITVFSEELPKELMEDLHNEHETTEDVIASETESTTTPVLPNLDIDNNEDVNTKTCTHESNDNENLSIKILDLNSF